MRPPTVTFTLELSSETPMSAEELQGAAIQLKDEITELGPQSVDWLEAKAPAGSKAGFASALGSLVIALAPEMIRELFKLIVDWLQRDPSRIIKIRQKAGGPEYEIRGSWKAERLAEIMTVLAKDEHAGS